MVVAAAAFGFVLFRDLADDGVGGEEEAGDGAGVGEGGAFYLGGDDDAHFDHVAVFVGEGVEAEVGVLGFHHLLGDDGAIDAGVFADLFDRGVQGAFDDIRADAFIAVELEFLDAGDGAEDRADLTAAGEDAFFDGGAAGVKGVFHAGFLFLHGGFRGCADFDQRHAAGEAWPGAVHWSFSRSYSLQEVAARVRL